MKRKTCRPTIHPFMHSCDVKMAIAQPVVVAAGFMCITTPINTMHACAYEFGFLAPFHGGPRAHAHESASSSSFD